MARCLEARRWPYRHKYGPFTWNGRPYVLLRQGYYICERCGHTRGNRG